ncbi:hypothetical protein [Chromobacterium piscinae]|uniref:hypothetical protein n=1 Tax=Chromobacterium piscinae TaxID=686831 RepID=UPI0032084797
MRITMLLPLALVSANLAANAFSLPNSALSAAHRAVDDTVRMQMRPMPTRPFTEQFKSERQGEEAKSEQQAQASPAASEPAEETGDLLAK